MSRPRRHRAASPAEREMREFTCRQCRKGPGTRCVTAGGTPRSDSHVSRYEQAVAAGRLPLDEQGRPVGRRDEQHGERTTP